MPKMKYKDTKSEDQEIMTLNRFYINKYYSIYMNAYKFSGIDEQQQYYILKRFWKDGKILAFNIADTETEENPKGELCFTPLTQNGYNIYDYPTSVMAVNMRGASFIPNTPMVNMQNCVVGYAHTSHASVCEFVKFYVDKICEVENTINTNLFTHKLPRLIVVSPEDRQRVNDLVEAIESGKHKLFIDAEDYNAIKNVLSGGESGYIIDKLYMYKQNLENELLTFMGIDNTGMDKRERLITDEANANNDIINDNGGCFLEEMRTFCENVNKVLGHNLSVKSTSAPVKSLKETQDATNGGNDNEEN